MQKATNLDPGQIHLMKNFIPDHCLYLANVFPN